MTPDEAARTTPKRGPSAVRPRSPLPANKVERMTPSLSHIFGVTYTLVLGAAVVYGVGHSLDWPLIGDASIFHYIAWRIGEGATPYRDIFDMNMPGVYLLHLLCLALLGPTDFGVRIFDLCISTVSFALLAAIGWRRSRLYGVVAGLFLFAYHISKGPYDMGQRDFTMAPFLLAAWWLLIAVLKQPSRVKASLGLGICCGILCWIKPVAVVLLLLCALALWSEPFPSRARRRALLWMGLGWMVPAALVNAWLLMLGGLTPFYETFFRFAVPVYGAMGALFTDVSTLAFLVNDAFTVGVLLFLLFKRTSLEGWRQERQAVLIAITYGLIHFYIQRKGYQYHAYPFWTAIAFYACLVLPRLHFANVYDGACVYAILLGVCITVSPLDDKASYIDDGLKQELLSYQDNVRKDIERALAGIPKSVAERYAPDGSLANHVQFFDLTYARFWNVAYRLHWIPANRYMYPFPLYALTDSAYMRHMTAECLQMLAKNPPLVILISAQSLPFPDRMVYTSIETREPWRSYFGKYYALATQTERYRLYARKQ